MKCISKILILFLVVFGGILAITKLNSNDVAKYETSAYASGVHEVELFTDTLCVESDDTNVIDFKTNDTFHSILLFDLESKEALITEEIHERLYPASTTKLMTLYLALKYGNLEDIVTVSSNAVKVPMDSSRAELCTGDQLSLESLLYALMLPSGNDSAVAIAEYISGNVESFVELMNEEANLLGATNTHFVNPHGYHNEDHYTTAYDLYLMLNACMEHDVFLDIVTSSVYETRIVQKNGTYRNAKWIQSNYYLNQRTEKPSNIALLGGKTGTTSAAGACITLYVEDKDGHPYIAIMMGSDSKPQLYKNMTNLLSSLQAS